MNNNEKIGFIRCSSCGELYHVTEDGLNVENSVFNCSKCGKNFDVPFFAYCPKCDKIVGVDNSSAFNIIVNGMFNYIKEPWSLLKFLPRVLDNIPSANGWGKCPFCDTAYIRCPRCSQLVEIDQQSEANEIIRCMNCGLNMRKP